MRRQLILAISLLILGLFSAPQPAAAYDFFGGACNSGSTSGSSACQSQAGSHSKNPVVDLLAHITNIVAFAAGAAAIIVILVAALRFITSGSDVSTGSRTDTDVEDARRAIANAIIGLVVIVLARTIILYVISKL